MEYRGISHLFGVGISTVCVAVHDVHRAIVESLAAQYISILTGQGLRRIVNGFSSKWEFLNASVQSMVLTFPSSPPRRILWIITTEKGIIL